MSSLQDPIREGLKRGWKVLGGAHGPLPASITCDVAIIGSGAGAGISAELLTKAGLNVVIIEEGMLKSSSDFNQKESEAYPSLYHESAGRKTEDKAINILQGRTVGGSTTVNWTSSFRTPDDTLKFWQEHFGLADYNPEALAPYFQQAENRLNIGPWLTRPTKTTTSCAVVQPSLAFRHRPSTATSKAAGTWDRVAWAAPPTPSSPCWSPPFPPAWTRVPPCWSKPVH